MHATEQTIADGAATSGGRPARRVVAAIVSILLLLCTASGIGLYSFVFGDGYIPAGSGWVGGHYYSQTTSRALIDLATMAAAAMLLAGMFSLSCALMYYALTQRRARRSLVAIPAVVAGLLVLALAVINPANLCNGASCGRSNAGVERR